MKSLRIALVFIGLVASGLSSQPKRPALLFNTADVEEVRTNLGKAPMFDAVFADAKARVERALAAPIDVPVPKDAGGYTHERHKQNYTEMQLAGFLFSVTKEERYAAFIRSMLMKYADLYPTLGDHPMKSGESAGRLFWQTLNETVWLVHTSQAYDCIYDWLSPADRTHFEEKIFRPMTKFFIVDHREEFDRIHDHGTWTVTAVGMAGYAMRDKGLVEQALYGTKKDRVGGFMKQLDQLFSPDGYYTEGPYYFRYAIMPFMIFAQAIENNQPEMKIFEYRKQILKKALYAGLQLTNTDGAFFPMNDALKEKSYRSPEVVLATDIVYQRYGNDPSLLSVSKNQGTVALLGAGYEVAAAVAAGKAAPFPYESVRLADGANGDEGGVSVLRSGLPDDQLTLAFKYSAHGLSHGHYDKLSIFAYDAGKEILQDYGAARFINVESKFGGRYLPETKAFAMQTIAHNTITVDGTSQYQGKQSASERSHPDLRFAASPDSSLQIVSAECATAYPGITMQRTLALITDAKLAKPVVIDLFRVSSDKPHLYELPFYYTGQFLYSSVPYAYRAAEQKVFGFQNGYQYLWEEGTGKPTVPPKFSWLQGNRYYTLTTAADTSVSVHFVRIGANDANFDLRREAAFILRTRASSYVFASVLEPHGVWDGNIEISRDAYGRVESVSVAASTADGTVALVKWKDGSTWKLMVANGASSATAKHELTANGTTYQWMGDYKLEK